MFSFYYARLRFAKWTCIVRYSSSKRRLNALPNPKILPLADQQADFEFWFYKYMYVVYLQYSYKDGKWLLLQAIT